MVNACEWRVLSRDHGITAPRTVQALSQPDPPENPPLSQSSLAMTSVTGVGVGVGVGGTGVGVSVGGAGVGVGVGRGVGVGVGVGAWKTGIVVVGLI